MNMQEIAEKTALKLYSELVNTELPIEEKVAIAHAIAELACACAIFE